MKTMLGLRVTQMLNDKFVWLAAAFMVVVAGAHAANPAGVAGCQLWFKADAGVETSGSGGVTNWLDQSGMGRNATQATEAKQPKVQANAVNNLPAIRFDLGNLLGYDGTFLAGTAYTIFVVEGRRSNRAGNWLLRGTAGTGNNNLIIGYRENTKFAHAQHSNDYDMNIAGYTSQEFVAYALDCGEAKHTWRNGVLLGEKADAIKLISYNGASVGGNGTYEGDIAEVIIYNRVLDDWERASVYRYLNAKYAINIAVNAAFYWNPSPLTANWADSVWASVSGGSPTENWVDASDAIFEQSAAYAVTNNAQQSVAFMGIEAGTVAFEGSGTVASEKIAIASNATLSGAGDRYLKIGSTSMTIDGTLDFTALQDASRTVTLDGGAGAIILGATLAANGTPAFTGSVSGSGGLTKVGTGELRVANSFTGPVNVQAGRLILNNAASGAVSVAAEAGLLFTQPAALVSALNAMSSTFDSAALAGIYNAGTLTNPNLTGADFRGLRFLKMGAGTLKLSQAAALANVTSGVVVATGELQYNAANAIAANTPIAVENGARLTFNYGPALLISHPLTIAGNYDEGDGSGSLFVNVNGGNASFSAPITLAGNTKIKAYSAGSTLNFNAPITGSGNLVIGGGGAAVSHTHTFNFNAPSTFAGNVTLKNDIGANAQFNWGVDNAMPTSAILKVGGVNYSSGTYANVDLKGHSQQTAGIANGAVIGAARRIKNSAVTTAALGLNVASGDLTYSGVLEGDIDIVKTGNGTQRITGGGGSYVGTVAVQQGSLYVGPSSFPNAEITVANGARILPNSDGVTTVGHTTITGVGDRGAIYFEGGNDTWSGNITIDGYSRIGGYGGGVITKTLNGVIDGSGTLNIWAGGGDVTHENVYLLKGANTFAGSLFMEASFGACLTVKLSGGDNRLPDGVPVQFNPTWNQAFTRLDLAGSANQRVGSLISSGNAARGRAVINSTAATTSTLTINTIGGSAAFEGVIGASGPCASAGAINLIKEGGGAQIFKTGSVFIWNNNVTGTNMVNANVTVNAGAIGFSGTDMLGAAYTVNVGANGALIAPNKAALDALRADGRFTIDPASPVGLYDTWDLTASDPARMFYYSGGVTFTTDNAAALPNGLILAGGDMRIGIDGAAGDAVFGSVDKPLILNGTSIKNSDNYPVLSASRTITVNPGGVAFTAGWSKELRVASKLSGAGGVNVNCDSGAVILSNPANDYADDTTIATQWAGYYQVTASLKLGASEVIPHGTGKGNLVLNTGATFEMDGFSETVNGLSSTAANALITNSSLTPSVLTVGAGDAAGSYRGTINGAISLVKTGAGTQSLSGPCTYSGSTVVQGGTLLLDVGGTLGSAIVEVHRDATLVVTHDNAFGGAASTTRLFAGKSKSAQGEQAQIEIPAGVDAEVLHFAIDGVFKPAGTWGATGSGADNINDAIFTGAGVLRVLETGPAYGTLLQVR